MKICRLFYGALTVVILCTMLLSWGGGGISDNSSESGGPSLAIAPNGAPYVAWYDSNSEAWPQTDKMPTISPQTERNTDKKKMCPCFLLSVGK